jgi:coiled-coil domain-containing protein 55
MSDILLWQHDVKADDQIEAQRKGKKGPGMTAFYKNLLEDDDAKHAAAVAASSAAPGPSLAIKRPQAAEYEPEAEYDPFLAQSASASTLTSGPRPQAGLSKDSGKEVEINDDGEVVDKRTLLKAGLNIMKKPAIPTSLLTSQKSNSVLDGPYKSRAVGSAATYQERMERERKRLASMIKEEEEKKRAERERAEREEEERQKKRREGDDGEAERKRVEARQRYLERKRAKEEEERANKKAKTDE